MKPASSTTINSSSPPPATAMATTNNATSDDVSSPPPDDDATTTTTTTTTLSTYHRKRKKRSNMISSMVLRPQFSDIVFLSRRRRRRLNDPSSSSTLDVDALIALSLGFPVDSLTDEEIAAGVIPAHSGADQSLYIACRNYILSRWRSNVLFPVSLSSPPPPPSLCPNLLERAYSFLLHHGYINFGLAPSIKNSNIKCLDGDDGVSSSSSCNVIVIGAGLAGLCAARQLRSMGFKVVLLEGRERPGGRVRTKKMGGRGGLAGAADLGGSVLTEINGNPLGVLARQLGFPLYKVRNVRPLYFPDGKAVDKEFDSRVEAAFNILLDRICKLRQVMMEETSYVDVSLGNALESFRNIFNVADDPQEKMLLNWHLANLEYANGSLLSNLSMTFWDLDESYEMGGDHFLIPGGNERFISALAEDLPILYDHVVESIRYGVDQVLVYAGGQDFWADMVLCTVPLGVLKRGDIKFVPPLPQRKMNAINRLGFGLLNKVAMLFPHNFWGGEIDTFGHLSENPARRGEFFLFYSYSSVSDGPLLVALVAGEAAIEFEKLSPLESVERVMDILRGIFYPKGVDVPHPVQAVCTRWGHDKFSYGSCSYVATGASADDYDILAESIGNGRVFFAGEATHRQYPATMHGAFLSGMREAANILNTAKRSLAPVKNVENIIAENTEDLSSVREAANTLNTAKRRLLAPVENLDEVSGENTKDLSGAREAANILNKAKRRSLAPVANVEKVSAENTEDLSSTREAANILNTAKSRSLAHIEDVYLSSMREAANILNTAKSRSLARVEDVYLSSMREAANILNTAKRSLAPVEKVSAENTEDFSSKREAANILNKAKKRSLAPVEKVRAENSEDLSGAREAANILNTAKRRSLAPVENVEKVSAEETKDLRCMREAAYVLYTAKRRSLAPVEKVSAENTEDLSSTREAANILYTAKSSLAPVENVEKGRAENTKDLSSLREPANILNTTKRSLALVEDVEKVCVENTEDLSGIREAANILNTAERRSLAPVENVEKVSAEDTEDLSQLFVNPDLKLGNLSILFDPRTDDLESHSLIRVEFRGERLETGVLHLYGLLSRSQAIELGKVAGDVGRLRMLNQSFGLQLVGRKGLSSVAEAFIASIRAKT